MNAKEIIQSGKAILGIEFGSTRIKAVLIDPEYKVIAQGSHNWENQLVDGLWTYSIEAIWFGLQDCYANLRKEVLEKYDTEIEILASIGISAMMHGFLAFDEDIAHPVGYHLAWFDFLDDQHGMLRVLDIYTAGGGKRCLARDDIVHVSGQTHGTAHLRHFCLAVGGIEG